MQLALGNPPRPRYRITFDWAVLLASLWFVSGLLLDGWAHGHLDLKAEGFFNPYHAVLYSGFLAVTGLVIGTVAMRRRHTASWREAIPRGHGATVAGIAVFAIGGVLDAMWHTVFGIEQDIQAILSPTHLVLAAGVALMILGPFRSVRSNPSASGWKDEAPAIVSFTLFLTLVEFFTQWAIGLGMKAEMNPALLYPHQTAERAHQLSDLQLTHDLLAMIVFGAIYGGLATFLASRIRAAFGAVTVILVASAAMLASMLDGTMLATMLLIVPALAAGVLADALRMTALLDRKPATRAILIAAIVPLAYWAAYFAVTVSTGGTWWEVHSLFGAPFLAVVASVMIALGQLPPQRGAA